MITYGLALASVCTSGLVVVTGDWRWGITSISLLVLAMLTAIVKGWRD